MSELSGWQNMACGKCASANTKPDERKSEGGRKSPAKFRAAWTHEWRAGPSKLTNSSPDVAVSILLVQRKYKRPPLPAVCSHLGLDN